MAEEAAEEGLDPARVPPFPVLWLEIRRGRDGVGEIWLDGERLAVDVPGEGGLYRAGLAAVGERAASRPGSLKAVRVMAVTADGDRTELVVDASGHARPVSDPGTARGFRSWAGLDPRKKLAAAAAIAVMVLCGGAIVGMAWPEGEASAYSGATGSSRPRPARPTPTQLPVLSPAGKVDTAVWSVGPLSRARTPVVVAGGRVVTVMGDGRLVGIDPKSSGITWGVALGRGASRAELSVAGDMVTAVTASHLVTVDAGTGATVIKRSLTRGDSAIATPLGAVVRRGNVAAQVHTLSGWVWRVVPPGSVPVAPLGSDLMTMNSAGQWWQVASDRVPPAARQLPAPEEGARPRGLLGTTQQGLLFAWGSQDGKRQLVQLYEWGDLSRPARTVTGGHPGTGAVAKDALQAAPDGSWFVLDQSLVEWSTGTVVGLPRDWRTSAVLSDRAYAVPTTDAVRVVTRSGDISTAPLPAGSRTPVSVPLAELGRLGLVVAAGDDRSRLYAVELTAPSSGTPTPIPSTTSPPKPKTRTPTGTRASR